MLSRLPAIGVSLPPFFVGLLLIQLFSFNLGWFPAMGSEGWKSMVLPAVMMAIPTSAMLAQVLTRSLSLPGPVPDEAALSDIACDLRARVPLPPATRYRLVGVGVSGFGDEAETPTADLFGG